MKEILPLSIVIPTKNEAETLRRLLSSIQNQTASAHEIIVADAGSSDDTKKIAKLFGASVVNGGIPSVGRNQGAQAAVNDYILFVDADAQLSSDTFLRDMLDSFRRMDLDCATCYFNPNKEFRRISGNIFAWIINRIKDISSSVPGTWTKFDWGILVLVKKDVFGDVGGFREDMRYLEDSQFIKDIVANGYRYSVLPQRIDIDLTRELTGGVVKCARTYITAVLGAMSLNIRSKRLRENLYRVAKDLYGSSSRDS